jgi:LmbE family N-acetylglucosaminyl deacetylase
MREIVLSPHLDDGVLSLGGFLYDEVKAGKEVEVWTFCCATPLGKSPEHYSKRRREDKEALKIIGAKPVHYGFMDALDRNKDGRPMYSNVFETVKPDDEESKWITVLLKTDLASDDKVFCPLAVGNHVDHVNVRNAVQNLRIPLTYYTDFPYIDYVPEKLDEAVVDLEKFPVSISPDGLSHWIAAMRKYESQALYPTQDITAQKITEYWAKINGVFLWRKQ